MAVQYCAEGIKTPSLKKRETTQWIKQVAAGYGYKTGDISYIFCSDEKILDINRTYLQHDYYTDIITFDYTENKIINGDIFISLETVRSNADEFQVDFENELHRIIIHGILHLCGINDKAPGERENMNRCENEALTLLSAL